MAPYWQQEFKERMAAFSVGKPEHMIAVSIKVRITSDCFHREHSPHAYRIIDDYIAKADLSDLHYKIEEHETGPEVVAWVALTAAVLGFAKGLVELITAIIKARSEGIKRGDRPSDPIEVIVRGHTSDGEYFEQSVMHVLPGQVVTTKQVGDALGKSREALAKANDALRKIK